MSTIDGLVVVGLVALVCVVGLVLLRTFVSESTWPRGGGSANPPGNGEGPQNET